MTPFLQLILLLVFIIVAAKSAGYVSTRLGQPAVLGELLAGLVLGPSVLDLLHWTIFPSEHLSITIYELGELGVIFLMFMAGLEVNLEEMLKAGKVSLLVGVLGVVAPLLLAIPVALTVKPAVVSSIFIGIILTATSVSISAQTLIELGVLQSKEGLALLGAAVVDDVLVILIVSLFLAVTGSSGGGALDVVFLVLRVSIFLGAAILIGAKFFAPLVNLVERLPISEGVIALVIVTTLLYAWSAEVIGEIAAITGAFIAGLFFARTHLKHAIEQGMHTLTYAFFVPIFLIGIGLHADARKLGPNEWLFALAIILVAIVGKVIGGWLGSRLGGFDSKSALRVGVGMVSRGEVGLIVAAIGLNEGLIDTAIYSEMVLMVLATTLVTPFLLRLVFARGEAGDG